MDQVHREINRARSGAPTAFAEVLERAVAICEGDMAAARRRCGTTTCWPIRGTPARRIRGATRGDPDQAPPPRGASGGDR
jgi:hypothetical protein